MLESVPHHLRPPDQIFRWLRIEHVDGSFHDWPMPIIPAPEWEAMTPYERAWSELYHDINLFYWAAGIHERRIEGVCAVKRIVTEWYGPVGSKPDIDQLLP